MQYEFTKTQVRKYWYTYFPYQVKGNTTINIHFSLFYWTKTFCIVNLVFNRQESNQFSRLVFKAYKLSCGLFLAWSKTVRLTNWPPSFWAQFCCQLYLSAQSFLSEQTHSYRVRHRPTGDWANKLSATSSLSQTCSSHRNKKEKEAGDLLSLFSTFRRWSVVTCSTF